MRRLPADILKALDDDVEDLKKDDSQELWPWSAEAAKLIRSQQDQIEYQGSCLLLAYELIESLRPEITASFISRKMVDGSEYDAAAARKMAQFFIETNDDIGALLDGAAAAFDAKNSQGSN